MNVGKFPEGRRHKLNDTNKSSSTLYTDAIDIIGMIFPHINHLKIQIYMIQKSAVFQLIKDPFQLIMFENVLVLFWEMNHLLYYLKIKTYLNTSISLYFKNYTQFLMMLLGEFNNDYGHF